MNRRKLAGTAAASAFAGMLLSSAAFAADVAPFTIVINQSPWLAGFANIVDAYEKATGKQYIPPLGYDDAAYDVLFDALQRAGSTDRAAVLKALAGTNLETVTGTVKFNEQHFSVQPLGGAQWRYDDKRKKLVKENVYNAVYPSVKKTGEMKLYN